MSIAQALLPEFDYEMANTRRTLERVPEDKLSWKPDPRSMAMGRLASHVAEMVNWGAVTMQTDSLNLDASFHPFDATSRGQLLAEFDKNVAAARAALESSSDDAFMKDWTLSLNGSPLMTM